MGKKILILLLFLGLSVLISKNAAASFNFSTSQTTLDADQELILQTQLSLQGQADKIYYLEGGFKAPGNPNNFGLTETNSGWVQYTSSNSQNLKEITTDSQGQWSGPIKVKIDKSSSLYQGPGNYSFHIGRFTQTGSSLTWSDDEISLDITSSSASSTSAPTSQSSSSNFIISNIPSSLDATQSFSVNIQLSGAQSDSTLYLKGAFFEDDSTNYFGKTKVNDSWIKNSQGYSSQRSITTDSSGGWQGNLEIMVDPDDSGFSGSGSYNFKVGYYSSSGTGPKWSNSLNLDINYTPTPGPTAQSTPTSAPSKTATPKPVAITNARSNSTNSALISLLSSEASVAGEATESAESAPPEEVIVGSTKPQGPNWLLIAIGGVVVAVGLIPLLRKINFKELIRELSLKFPKTHL